jgi:2,4-dienoyl-CoA reductase-like NADH-dependent reductase (Old Yellow Enzyme family)
MAEQMADCHQLPTAAQFDRTYGGWADGGWGMIVTGYVQVDGRYLGSPDDLAIDATRGLSEDKVVAAYKKLATVSRRAGTPSIIQINHVGRQSPVGAGTHRPWSKTLAPSAIPLDLGSDFMSRLLVGLIFGIPKEMTIAEIEDIVQRFANAARIAAKAGFDGVQIHAAHGYLLAQFMSARSNHRTDAYGSSAAARAKIVLDIIKAVRAVVPKTFCVGLKLNSVDHQTSSGASSEMEDCLQQAALIAEASLDFIEVSGGSYENPLVSSPSKGGFWMHAVMLTRVDVYRSRESSYSVCKNGSPGILLS